MAISTSLLLMALGAVLAFAVNYTVQGIELQTIGLILLVVGIVGLIMSLLFMANAPTTTTTRDTTHHDHI